MDINRELNEIIFQYHLDRYYPHYRNMYQAQIAVTEMIEEIKQSGKRVIFIGNDKKEENFVRYLAGDYEGISFLLYNRKNLVPPELVQTAWGEYDSIWIFSFDGGAYIERWFCEHKITCEWIYDFFERMGIFLQRSFLSFCPENLLVLFNQNAYRDSNFTGPVQCELYCQRNKYDHAVDRRTRRIALEKCLFLTLYMRNFVEAKTYIDLLAGEDRCYEDAWNEIQDLLCRMKKVLSGRRQKDFIVYWLDAIPYGGEENMPYLQSIMEKSVSFQNAFTYIPFTKPTLRALLLEKKDIDDGSHDVDMITRQNSDVIRFLEKQGYRIRAYSGYFNICLPAEYQAGCFVEDEFCPASRKMWGMLSDMLLSEEKTFYIIHAFDSHSPYLGSRMSDYKNDSTRYKLIKEELDALLEFYDAFLDSSIYRIYMSDHGRDSIYKYHVLFNVYHESLRARKADGMFSLLNFGKVLRQLVQTGDLQEAAVCGDYVEIGNCDRYNKRDIINILQKKKALGLYMFGAKGIIDQKYIYIHFNTGRECLHQRDGMLLCEPLLLYECPGDVCEPELLPKYRELAGEYPEDMIRHETFRYAGYLYKLYHNILQHNNMRARIDMINQIVGAVPSDNSVAIRMGGVTSSVFYRVLSEENKKKIWGFIDHDKNCLCSRFQLPVAGTDELEYLKKSGVKAIAIPSYNYLHIMRAEAGTWPEGIAVLDIYEHFETNQIECNEDFHTVTGRDEDYDVGFPFDEP